MKQVNGTGSIVSGISVLCACACAECIPAMFGFVALAGGGVAWDMLRGERVKRGAHMSGKFKSAGYKGRHERLTTPQSLRDSSPDKGSLSREMVNEGIKKSPRRVGTRSRRNENHNIYSIEQSERNVKGVWVGC